ncbi:metallo-beta-lactamase family hydrolase protein (plasmid) [Rhizobium phaseoli]|uniref:hypothetical protein n=1 Tax=Rhizobium phaseoli TaxID=396 RepID=UPI0007EAFF86|nr:hypothetical protein [Rhizobium phaseoli]ANL49729.1 metallo-beta-lactamase family hydrolase protein [Rhizobium phaseoli]
MIVLEALNALYGDCLILRYTDNTGKEAAWVIDGGPRSENVGGKNVAVWKDFLLPRLLQLSPTKPIPIALGMVSHIDDDHINGLQRLANRLTAVDPQHPAEVKFDRFWFNSFEDIVGPCRPASSSDSVHPQALAASILPNLGDEDAQAIVESVGQGMSLAADLGTLHLKGNPPFGGLIVAKAEQNPIDVRGAKVTVVGPLKARLDDLQTAWCEAVKKPTKEAREAAVQALFLPDAKLDKSIPNLSSIAVLVEIRGKKIFLTGDAQGKDLVEAWKALGHADGPVNLDVLKVPHHGSRRNNPEVFFRHFVADSYVFSANGKYDNPDPETLEGLVSIHHARQFTMYFTNGDITWEKPYRTQSGQVASELGELLARLKAEYSGTWDWKFRDENASFVPIWVEE